MTNVTLQDIVRQVSNQVDMGTVQVELAPWDGLYLQAMENSSMPRNYVRIVPAVTVFDNIIKELFARLNISEPITIIIDEIYSILFIILMDFKKLFLGPADDQWKTIFGQLELEITYLTMANVSVGSEVYDQIRSINTRVVVLVAKTSQIEHFILHSQEIIETSNLTWIAYSKDTLPFKCEDCTSVDMYWVKTLHADNVTDLRRIADFVSLQELDVGMNYKIYSYEELWAIACIDAMKMSFLFLLAENETLRHMAPDNIQKQVLAIPGNMTMNDVLQHSDLLYEYGPYVYYYRAYYYQVSSKFRNIFVTLYNFNFRM